MVTEPEMFAGHVSKCRLCRRAILCGDPIRRIPGGAWCHSLCAAALRRTREAEEVSDVRTEDAA